MTVRRVNPPPLDPSDEHRKQVEQQVLAERDRLLADEASQDEADQAREAEEARANEATEVELGLRSIWGTP